MTQNEGRLNLAEQEAILQNLLSTHVDQWVHLTNILHAYPDIEKITRDDVIVSFHVEGTRHRCTTPHLTFNFNLKRALVGGKDELSINVGVGDNSCLYGLENLTHYREHCTVTGIDRETLVSVIEQMTTTLGQYLSLESELRPWLKLRTLGVNAATARKQAEEAITEEGCRKLDWSNYGVGRDDYK